MTTTTVHADRTGPVPGARDASAGRPGWLLVTVLAGQFMALLDVFIVNVAAATLREDLGTSDARLQLIVAGYTIAYAVLLVTGARLGGRFGPGRLYLSGLGVFTAASLACGLAATDGQLLAFRVLQGVGAAAMMPQVLALIQRTFTGAAKARALTLFAAVIATGAAAGQILGGVLINADLFGWGWRPVFLVNVPLGLLLLGVGLRALPLGRPRAADRARPLDLGGLALLAVAVLLCTVPLVLGQERGWPAWCWLCLAGSGLVVAALVGYEARLAARGGAPLVAPRVLRATGTPMIAIFLVMALNGALLFSLALHLQGPESQGALGYGALRTGLTFLPMAIGFGATSLAWRALPGRLLPALVPAGMLLVAGGMLTMGLLLRDGGDGGVVILVGYAVTGVGMALAYGPPLAEALARVAPADAADVSGVTAMVTQLGTLGGVAAFGALYLDRAAARLSSAEGVWTLSLALTATALVGAVAGVRGARAASGR
ncbi:MFS transporter [Streptomyces triticirhizae]|uniref:MFS transporter n=1 Tax=Streptomyces triticirhizae TaxID=2483353 RepID=A0A3M2LHD3_9ACTN|nr:MFS transporter [Streptomyces triticirhizae]RMI35973.1 MFS transporter [Streptomyces triticirhizae]